MLKKVILLSLLFWFSSQALAIGFDGISGYPANPDPKDERTKSWFIYTLDPGVSKEDVLVVTNSTNEAQTISLTAVDSMLDNMGGFSLAKETDPQKEIGSWVTLKTSQVTLEAGKDTQVPFTITIPLGTSPGEYSGGIVIQKVKGNTDQQEGFTINTRVGIRIYAMVPGELIRKIMLDPIKLETLSDEQQYRLAVTLKNEGNVSVETGIKLTTTQDLWVKKRTYISEKNVQVQKGTSTTSYFTVPMSDIGALNFTVEASYFDGEKQRTITAVPLSTMNIPWLAILGGAFITGFLIGIIFLIGKHRKKQKKTRPAGKTFYTIEKGDTPQKIARKTSFPWKKIAQINGLSDLLKLTPGDTLELPNDEKEAPLASFSSKSQPPILLKILMIVLLLLCFAVLLQVAIRSQQESSKQESKATPTPIITTPKEAFSKDDVEALLTVLPSAEKNVLLANVPAEVVTNLSTTIPDQLSSIIATSVPPTTLTAFATYIPASISIKNQALLGTPSPSIPSPTPTISIPRSAILLRVLNGNATAGSAKKLGEKLTALGYQVTEIGNADTQNYKKTVIKYPKSLFSSAQAVSSDLDSLGYSHDLQEDQTVNIITGIIGKTGKDGEERPLTPVQPNQTRAILDITP